MKFSLYILFVFCITWSFSSEIRYPLRSPRGLLMGDAFTGVANDEYAIFYNPAALGRHHGFNMTTINPTLQFPDILDDTDRFDDIPDTATGVSGVLMDYPLHFGAGIAAGFRVESFSMVGYSTSQSNVLLLNQTSPEIDVDYRLDNGFVMSYAWAVGPHRLNKKGQGQQYSLGLSLRYLKRKVLKDTFPLLGTELMNIISSDPEDVGDIINGLGPQVGKAWAYDLGLEYFMNSGINQLVIGVSFLDAMGTSFDSTDASNPVEDQEMRVSTGMAFSQNLGLMKYTFSADYHPVLSPIDEGRKIHLGASVQLGNLELLTGYNAGYYSYGVGIDFWLFEIYAGFYDIEVGNNFQEKKSKRGLIYFNLAELEFDF